MRPISKVLTTAGLAVLAAALTPAATGATAGTGTAAAARVVAAPPEPRQDWIYRWPSPVRRTENWCEPGRDPIRCHTQTHTRYPTVTVTAVNRRQGLEFSASGSNGVATMYGLLPGCYDTTISVSGLGRYVSRNEAITMVVSRSKRLLVGGGSTGVSRVTVRDGNRTGSECVS